MEKIIIEVGSTVTKIDKYDGKNIERLETYCISFKKNFKEKNRLNIDDVKKLIYKVQQIQKKFNNVYVCGTSIFRNLLDNQKKEFLNLFKNETGLNFEIISQERENELTVYGATQNVNKKVAVFVGGGGSTEIAIFDKKIKEMVNTKFGVIDVMNLFPDLAEDLPHTTLEEVKQVVKYKLNIPKTKADILILAGGGHKFFALNSGFKYVKNTLYNDYNQPIMMDIETRIKDSKRYYEEISLDNIKNRVDDPEWWYATRAMVSFVLVVAEEMGAKYIIPTDVSMVYGLLE